MLDCGMGITLADMTTTEWRPDEVKELAALAKRKGYNKGVLATLIGVHPSTLSIWMKDGRTDPIPDLSRNALAWVRHWLGQMKDLPMPQRKGATEEKE